MPIHYKLPAYLGNAFLVLLGSVGVLNGSLFLGGAVALTAALNLYLVRKLDQFSREEAWLAGELRKAQMREELAAIEGRLAAREPRQLPDRTAPGPQE